MATDFGYEQPRGPRFAPDPGTGPRSASSSVGPWWICAEINPHPGAQPRAAQSAPDTDEGYTDERTCESESCQLRPRERGAGAGPPPQQPSRTAPRASPRDSKLETGGRSWPRARGFLDANRTWTRAPDIGRRRKQARCPPCLDALSLSVPWSWHSHVSDILITVEPVFSRDSY